MAAGKAATRNTATTNTASEASSKVRRIAILVTSLDAAAGRQLLLAMPTELARQVRRTMTQLGPIDPIEQREILAEFRLQAITATDPVPSRSAHTHSAANRASTPPTSTTHTEHSQPNWSADATDDRPAAADSERTDGAELGSHHASHRAGQETSHNLSSDNRHDHKHRPWQRLQVEELTELLSGERAPVIAVVLSQLPASHAAGLLEKLAAGVQRDVIAAFSQLGQIDPEAMAAIDEHLAGRISDYHHQRAGESETLGRMQDLLAAASPQFRQQWQTIIQDTDHQLAKRMGLTSAADVKKTQVAATSTSGTSTQPPTTNESRVVNPSPLATESTTAAVLTSQKSREAMLLEMLSSNVVTTADARSGPPVHSARPAVVVASQPAKATSAPLPITPTASSADEPTILPFRPQPTAQRVVQLTAVTMRFDELLDMPPEQIGEVLAAVSTEVILLALAGASPAFMKRFTSMLEKRDARALQNRLKKMTSINLKDVDEAQRQLCQRAMELKRSNSEELDEPPSLGPSVQRTMAA